jgi:argininosuccinate synthase
MLQKEAYQSRPLKRSRGQWMQILPTATDDPLKAPNEPTDITVSFQKGIPTKLVTPQETFTDLYSFSRSSTVLEKSMVRQADVKI